MEVLIVGGCHTYGFGNENLEDGFLQKFISKLEERKSNVKVTIYAPITIAVFNNSISCQEIKLKSFDLILLQLGNYEFDIKLTEFNKLFDFGKIRIPKDYSNTKPLNNDSIEKKRGIFINEDRYSFFEKTLKKMASKVILPFIKAYAKFKVFPKYYLINQDIDKLFSNLESVSNKTIVLSPFPLVFQLPNYFRYYGSEIFKKKCQQYKIPYLNFHKEDFFRREEYFLKDMMHLNVKGHNYVFKVLSDSYQE